MHVTFCPSKYFGIDWQNWHAIPNLDYKRWLEWRYFICIFWGIDVGCWVGLFVARALQNNELCNHACIQVAKPFTQL